MKKLFGYYHDGSYFDINLNNGGALLWGYKNTPISGFDSGIIGFSDGFNFDLVSYNDRGSSHIFVKNMGFNYSFNEHVSRSSPEALLLLKDSFPDFSSGELLSTSVRFSRDDLSSIIAEIQNSKNEVLTGVLKKANR